MAKDKTAIVSGAGWIGGFVDLLVREMLKQEWTHEGIHALVTQTKPEDQPIEAIVRGMRKGFPSAALAEQYGYTVLEDLAKPTEFAVKDLEFIPVLKDGELPITGDVMRDRAVTLKANFGLCDVPRLLDQQADIPVELQDKYIVLAATKLRDRDGNLYVAYLNFSGKRWCLIFFGRLDDDWVGDDRFPRCK